MRTAPDTLTLSREAQRARELLQVGRPARAASEFRRLVRVVEALPESPAILEVRARVLLGLAAAGFEVSGRFDEAVALLNEARRLADDAGAEHLMVPIEGQRALLLLRRGDFRSALAVFDRAGEGLAAAAPYDRMTLLLNRGSLHLERGGLTAALRDLEECGVLAEEHQVVTLAWKAQHNLGWAEFLAGRIPRAIATLERAESLNPGEPHPIGMLDRARVLREAGLVQEAEASLERAAEAQRAAGSWQDLAETEMARAECALLAGRPGDALVLARSARHRLARRSNVTLRRRAEVLVLQCSRAAADTREGAARGGGDDPGRPRGHGPGGPLPGGASGRPGASRRADRLGGVPACHPPHARSLRGRSGTAARPRGDAAAAAPARPVVHAAAHP